jgi:iron complex outermembrane receptor protein
MKNHAIVFNKNLYKLDRCKLHLKLAIGGIVLTSTVFSTSLSAQEETGRERVSMLEEIIVSAQKKSVAESVQDVPIAITALSGNQLDALNFRALDDIATISPNVTLDRNGNSRSHANFTIRGSGVNSSIPTVESAVGLFVNGVYQGIPAGSVLDNFDMGNIQILRGPQGTLFGRNVTGGAVLVETRRPSGETGGELKTSLETGLEYGVTAAYETSLSPGKVDARVAVYYRKDEGWFKNEFDGSDFGKAKTIFARPTFLFHLNDDIEETLIIEYGSSEGDGAAEQGYNLIGVGDGFQINLNERGHNDVNWTSLTSETTVNVAFGDGVITNVFGWRNYEQELGYDVDGSPFTVLHTDSYMDQEQFSNELRYAGNFEGFEVTVGAFYFTQDLFLVEGRLRSGGAVYQGSGGEQSHDSFGVFSQIGWNLTDDLKLVTGLRYSSEKKDVKVVRRTTSGGCFIATKTCDFSTPGILDENESWDSISPKLSLEYTLSDNVMFYATYSEATRSGGYNLRISTPLDPGVFDQEDVTNYELGMKSDLMDGRIRLNSAVFHTELDDLQRTVNAAVGNSIIQTITNGADAEIDGIEVDLTISVVEGMELMFNAGYIDMGYTDVFFDLNGDGVLDDKDKGLDTPRVSPWSAGLTALGYYNFDSGASLDGRISYSYRDAQAANDANKSEFSKRNDVAANITYTFPEANVELSIYGRNLLDHVPNSGAGQPIPPWPSGGFRSIGEGRSVGVSAKVYF